MTQPAKATYTATAGTANTPQGHADEIAGTLAERATALLAAVRFHKIDVLGTQEDGPLLHAHYTGRQGIGAYLAPWNTRGAGGRTTSNGLLWRTATTDVLHVRPLRFRWTPARHIPATVAKNLSFVEALCVDLATESLRVRINGHIPRLGDADAKTRDRIVKGLRREGLRMWHRFGLPVEVTLDDNRADLTPLLEAGFKVAARRGVDVVLVLGAGETGEPLFVPAAAWSDHDDLVAVEVTYACTKAANINARDRLPRRARWFRR